MTDKTVLIADDDHELTQSLATRLRPLGFSVMRSPDASHALIGAMKILPDLIILDVEMPNGNGLAVCEMLTGDARFHGIPVIIHTGLCDPTTISRCSLLGALYIHKCPGSPATITEIARRYLLTDPKQKVETVKAGNETSKSGELGILS